MGLMTDVLSLTDHAASRRDAVGEWIVALSPGAIAAYLLLATAAIALVGGLVGIARRVQRGAERRRAASVLANP